MKTIDFAKTKGNGTDGAWEQILMSLRQKMTEDGLSHSSVREGNAMVEL